ncbi:MAG: hypothetical protein KAR08_01980 [Candidatus Heimdallarchaeota archaeon]|nr:hypothetical protein [Candidatus Heimdallarchaeota archaeon]
MTRGSLDTLSSIISAGLDAFEVILGTAYFKDRLGEQITNEGITLIDNPLYSWWCRFMPILMTKEFLIKN